jgi:hypothetical protein
VSIYLKLTTEFNRGRLRAVICSGQAVVLHRLAIMSKDGDWILREDEETLLHILSVLEARGAIYRFGAPLDLRWLRGGWSSHFEFRHNGLRVRTDFFTRPPRLVPEDLQRIWEEQAGQDPPFTSAPDLARIKMTQREKDYPVIGELARLMPRIEDQLRFSRSARDLCSLAADHPALVERLARDRPLLALAAVSGADADRVGEALDAERRLLIKADAERVGRFEEAAGSWKDRWPRVYARIEGLPLREVHAILTREANGVLPEAV